MQAFGAGIARRAFQLVQLCLLISSVACDTIEIGKCSAANIVPTVGLCSGKVFNNRMCTGSSTVFAYASETVFKNWADSQSRLLGSFSSTDCPIDQTCKKFLPTTSVSENARVILLYIRKIPHVFSSMKAAIISFK